MKIEAIRLDKLNPALLEKAARLAKHDGLTLEAWLTETATKLLAKKLTKDTDLSPKEAAAQLGMSKWTMGIAMRQGAFPGLYYVNSRVVRIPQADVDSYKGKRMRFVA